MPRYQIKVEYDGTNFVGWQYQKNGLSIQEILQNAIFQFSREKVTVTGAGRTDAGVHAIGQVAHFDLKKKIKKRNFLLGVNQYIGKNPVTVLDIKKTHNKFHSRFDAKKRTYQYVIINRQSPLALQKNKAWHIRKKLDLNAFIKSSNLHLPSPKYLMQPTIDLTCCCKKDLEVNLRIILSLFFLIKTLFKVLIGHFAPQEEARNVEKS